MKIKVGPYTYKVKEKKLRKKYGTTDVRRHVILLEPDQAPDTRRDTLLHETLHACYDLVGLPQNEDHITRLSPALLAVLRDNPKLRKALLAD